MLVGITGGIGSGKSTLARRLLDMGYPVYDSDNRAKHIIVHNPMVRSQVEVLFGSEVFEGDCFDTKLVSAKVFTHPGLLDKLNAIVHPAVAFDIRHWYERLGHTVRYAFVESAILYSSGLDALCDRVVLVTAPLEVRLSRVMERDKVSRQRVLERVNAQAANQYDKADIVLSNDGSRSVDTLVDELLEQLLTIA